MLSLALPLLLWLNCNPVPQSVAHTLHTKDPERKLILNALRLPVEKELKQKVVFKVDHLKVQGGWAFLRGVPRQADGGTMDYRRTKYQGLKEGGVFDDWICALLREREGKWVVVRYVIGATDVVYEGWDQEFKAPAAIFKE